MMEIFLNRFWSLLTACFIVGLMASSGRYALAIIFRESREAPSGKFFSRGNFETLFFSAALGYGIVSFFIFIQGVVGFYHGIKFTLSIAVFACAAFFFISRLRNGGFYPSDGKIGKSQEGQVHSPQKQNDPLSRVFDIVGIVAHLVAFALAFIPPHYYDSLVYHLALPAEYIKNNSISPVAYNLYAHFPQNAEMIFLAALKIADEVSANLATFIVSVLFSFGVRHFIKKNFNSVTFLSAASIGFFLVATAPFFIFLAPSTYVEFHVSFLTFAAFWAAMKYIEALRDGGKADKTFPTRIAALSGILAGFAIGVKYTAFAVLIGLNIMILAAFLGINFNRVNNDAGNKTRSTDFLRDIFFLNLAAMLVASPWFFKNYIFTGNPVFPFFWRWFGGASSVGWNHHAAAGYFAALTEYSHKSSPFMALLSLPYDILARPLKFGGGIDVLGDFGWYPILFFCAISVFLLGKKQPKIFYLFFYTFIVGIIWFFTKPVLRFLVPASGVMAVLGGVAAGYFFSRKSFYLKTAVLVLLLLFTAQNFYYFNFIVRFFRPADFLMGRENKSEYLSRTLRYSPYPAFEFINNLVKNNDNPVRPPKVFFVGEQRSFYCHAPLVAPSVFAPNPLVEWANGAASPDALLDKLRAQEFTLIFYNITEGERLAPYGIFDFTPRGKKNWEGLISNLRRRIIYRDKNSVIYDIT